MWASDIDVIEGVDAQGEKLSEWLASHRVRTGKTGQKGDPRYQAHVSLGILGQLAANDFQTWLKIRK